jgi:MFS family permease
MTDTLEPATPTRKLACGIAPFAALPQSACRMPSPAKLSPSPTAWTTLAVLSALNMFNYLDRYVMSSVVVPMQKELGMNDGDAGWAASAFMLGYFITAPIFGYLGDRYPRKYLMLAGVIIWSLATAGSGLAHGFHQLFAIRMLVGVGEAAFVTICPSWISDIFAATARNTALTLFYVAIPFGSAMGFALGGWFAGHDNWRGAFIYAGLPGVLLALSLLFLREPRRGEADGVELPQSVPGTKVREVAGLFLNRRYNLLVWGYAAQTFAIGAFGFWGPAFLHRVHGMSLESAATIFGAMLAGSGLCATLIGGFFANFLRRRTAAGYVWVLASSMIVATPVCFFALMTGSATLSLVGLGMSMFFLFLPTGPVVSELYEIVPIHLRASAMALSIFVTHLFGDFGSPTVVGHISTALGDLQKAVLILPAMLLVGAVLWSTLIVFTREPLEVEA